MFSKAVSQLTKLGLTKTATLYQRTVSEDDDPFSGESEITWTSAGEITIIVSKPAMSEGFPELKQEEEVRTVWTVSEITYLDRLEFDSKLYSVGPVDHHDLAGYYSASVKRVVETE